MSDDPGVIEMQAVWALRQYVNAKIEDLEGQVNRRIATGQREIAELRQHFNAILQEKDRAVEMAEAEREKAAAALSTALAKTISDGDERLREHIANQIDQINRALASEELLELERVAGIRITLETLFEEKQRALDAALAAQREAVTKAETATDRIAAQLSSDQDRLRAEMTERLAAVRRELEAATTAQKDAVIKQEQANERRFESVNEWRAQSADRERSQAEERLKLQASFMLKEVGDTRFEQIVETMSSRYETVREMVSTLASRIDQMQGSDIGARRSSDNRHASITSTTAILLTVAAFLTIVVLVAVATHGFTK